jgi:hypothetical protein
MQRIQTKDTYKLNKISAIRKALMKLQTRLSQAQSDNDKVKIKELEGKIKEKKQELEDTLLRKDRRLKPDVVIRNIN